MYEGLHKESHLSKIPEDTLKLIKELISQIDKLKLYRGQGGELIRAAVCHYIYCVSKSRLEMSPADILLFFSTLEDNFRHPNIEI